jgi:hypothetical protein
MLHIKLVRTSQETHYLSATELSRLIQYKIYSNMFKVTAVKISNLIQEYFGPGGRSVRIVRLRSKSHGFCFVGFAEGFVKYATNRPKYK